MTTVNYNLKTADLFFDGQAIWRVLDTYPENVRVQNINGDIRYFHYDEINGEVGGVLTLESPKDYDYLNLRNITEKTAEWLAQKSDLSEYAIQQVYNRVLEGWPSVSARSHLAANPATPTHILWGLLETSADLASRVAGNPSIPERMANILATYRPAYVRRSLARNPAIQTYPDVVKRLSEDTDKTVKIALEVAMGTAIED